MQRSLLYLAVALIILALSCIVFVRVTSSDAYVARQYCASIQPGMSREAVRQLIPNPTEVGDLREIVGDWWRIGENYSIVVLYDGPSEGAKVTIKQLGRASEESAFDKLLEWLGFPEAVGF